MRKDGHYNKYALNGKTAIVTGAAGLLGREHAIALLDSGASVVLTDIHEERLADFKCQLESTNYPGKIYTQTMDVGSAFSIDQTIEYLNSINVNIEILVNNAAIDPKIKGNDFVNSSRLENFPLDTWENEIRVGLTGAFLCSKAFGASMAKRNNGGVILNISSDLSVIAPDQRLYLKDGLADDDQPVKPVTYSVIKSGLIGLTRYLASYWADHNIRCNALSPGGVYNGQEDAFVQRLINRIPMGRMANKDEYRSAIQFLCSDASSYMTGQNIVIDGGRSLW